MQRGGLSLVSTQDNFEAATGTGASDWAKSVFDRVAAFACLVMAVPLLAVIALLIRWSDPGPVLYAHRRIGRGGRPFDCWKFRTMATDGDLILTKHLALNEAARQEWHDTRKLKDDPRVNRMGRFLRRSSLDELPQLINILRGEMSVVGPRPIVEDEIRHYDGAIADYVSVLPGLTGLWQVSGRNDVGYEVRVSLDQQYVQTRSFAGDLWIILRTVRAVLLRTGSY